MLFFTLVLMLFALCASAHHTTKGRNEKRTGKVSIATLDASTGNEERQTPDENIQSMGQTPDENSQSMGQTPLETTQNTFLAADEKTKDMGLTADGATKPDAGDGSKVASMKQFLQNTTFSGYIIGKALFSDQDIHTSVNPNVTSHCNFDIRLIRLLAKGRMGDFKYQLQCEMNGTANSGSLSSEKSPHVVDAWLEWAKYTFAAIRFGEFKRAFTFENPYTPWETGFHANSQIITKLCGYIDRVGEHSSAGRDLGIQLQGDLIRSKRDTHPFLHYQIGIYNGQGINHADANKAKDVIGGLWVMPIKGLNIGAFGWAGDYTKNGVTVDRNRMAFGVKYESEWTVRAEYITSEGHKISDYDTTTGLLKATATTPHADGWYAAVGVPVLPKLKIYGKWDVYRDGHSNDTRHTTYDLSFNYSLYKNLLFQVNYYYTDDKTDLVDGHYNAMDCQVYWRF